VLVAYRTSAVGGTVQGPKQELDIEILPMPHPARLKDIKSATAVASA